MSSKKEPKKAEIEKEVPAANTETQAEKQADNAEPSFRHYSPQR